ncbi:hypothetical protein QWJ34_01020 [Saccharibacillus sp. CPCC 101409]|nr:hypothetical protein [Saccharibacillus sp. CPCC 101409]MDO3408341.1 hypothetical protein [Saccharibacillus sp. CPCC 101409]
MRKKGSHAAETDGRRERYAAMPPAVCELYERCDWLTEHLDEE